MARAERDRAARACHVSGGRYRVWRQAGGEPEHWNAAIGYVAVRGDQALVGSTGTFCVPAERPRCFTNTDPAALLSGGKSFGTLWAQADRATSSNVYKLAPCVKIGGRWHLHLPSS